jgi:hypothetical protein
MQLLNHLFITKNQLLMSENKPDSEFDSNNSEKKNDFKIHRKNSSKQNLEKQDFVGLLPQPAQKPSRKASDWNKNSGDFRKKDQPFEKTASKEQPEKQHAPNPKKKIQITEQYSEKDTITAEILETEKFRHLPNQTKNNSSTEEAKQNNSKFKNTQLALNGVVKNPKAWQVSEAETNHTAEQASQVSLDKLKHKDEIQEEPDQAELKSSYQGMEPNELAASGDQSVNISVYNYGKIQEAEAAQKKLLEEMMMDLPDGQKDNSELHKQTHKKMTMSEIEQEQNRLLEDMCLDGPERLPTIFSIRDSPDKHQPADLNQIEAEQMRLLEEMMQPAQPVTSKKQSTDEKYLTGHAGVTPHPSPKPKNNGDRTESTLT